MESGGAGPFYIHYNSTGMNAIGATIAKELGPVLVPRLGGANVADLNLDGVVSFPDWFFESSLMPRVS